MLSGKVELTPETFTRTTTTYQRGPYYESDWDYDNACYFPKKSNANYEEELEEAKKQGFLVGKTVKRKNDWGYNLEGIIVEHNDKTLGTTYLGGFQELRVKFTTERGSTWFTNISHKDMVLV